MPSEPYSGDTFVKVTQSGSRSYVKLVEAFCDEAGVALQHVIATLGRVEQIRSGSADALVRGLLRVSGSDDAALTQARAGCRGFAGAFRTRSQRGGYVAVDGALAGISTDAT